MSQLAVAGKRIYDKNCVECHGYQAIGGPAGPSLHPRYYWRDQLDKRRFHQAITEGVVAYRWTFGDMPPITALSFNEIELVARYVHETQQPYLFQ